MAVPEPMTSEQFLTSQAHEIDEAIRHVQAAVRATQDGSTRRVLYDAAMYLDVARSILRPGDE